MNFDILSVAKEGTAILIVILLFVLALKIIKEYPDWRKAQNEHEIKLKEMENTKEEKVASIVAQAMDKNSQALVSLTKVVEGLVPILKQMDLRCEGNSQKLTHLGMRAGLTAVKSAKFAKQERGENNG